eukprot:UN33994
MVLDSSTLGNYSYNFELKCTTNGPEKIIHFNTQLGESDIQTYRFHSFDITAMEYDIEATSPEFVPLQNKILLNLTTTIISSKVRQVRLILNIHQVEWENYVHH